MLGKSRPPRVRYDLDLLDGGWVLWRTSGPDERVVAEGRFRLVGRLLCWHRRLRRSRPPTPPPQPGLELIEEP